ncbi:IS3 family transposase, partial [Citrobacter freundii]|uniref:IS3 family transposase n=1 Tax=Citrobacter freundii TaxID=546 RepID=UPI0024E142F0
RKRAYCLKIQPATGSFARNLIYSTKPKRIYKTRDLARADIFDYIEVFYNRARRHSHLGGVSPEAFEQASS